MHNETPINKAAALFLSRKKRVTSVQEALNKLAIEVCSAATVEEIRKIMRDKAMNEHTGGLKISLVLKPDGAEPNKVWCAMETKLVKDVGRETFGSLDL